MNLNSTLSGMAPFARALLRIVSGLIFMEHGLQKMIGFPPGGRVFETFSLPWIAGIFELVCGALIVIGLFTRPAAFVASGVMAFAYWIAHAPQDFYPVNNGGDAAILYCFVFLYFVFAGPGALSVDGVRRR